MNVLTQAINCVQERNSFLGTGLNAVTCAQEDERTIPFLRRLYEMIQENPDTLSFLPGTGPPVIPYEGPAPIVPLRNAPGISEQNATQFTIASNHRLGHIVVHDRKLVEKNVIPRYFNHSSFASLRRQLNYFNFERVGRGRQKGATYQNDGVVVLEDILRLKRKPNINPGDAENGVTNDDSPSCVADAETKNCELTTVAGQWSNCAIPISTETNIAQRSIHFTAPNNAQVQAVTVPAPSQRPHMLIDGSTVTTYTIPSGSVAYVPQNQAVTNQYHQSATVYYTPNQLQIVGSTAAPAAMAHQAEGMPQHVLIPFSTSSGTLVQVVAQVPTGMTPAPSHLTQACVTDIQRSSKSPTARIVSQSDMSAALESDNTSTESSNNDLSGTQDWSNSKQASPTSLSQAVDEMKQHANSALTGVPKIAVHRKRKRGEQDEPSDESKTAVEGTIPAAVLISPFLNENILPAKKPALMAAPSTTWESQLSGYQLPPAQCPSHAVEIGNGSNTSSHNHRYPAIAESRRASREGLHLGPNEEATLQSSPSKTLNETTRTCLPVQKEMNLSASKPPAPIVESISDEVLYETRDGYPLKKEDLLLCAALIHLGGQP